MSSVDQQLQLYGVFSIREEDAEAYLESIYWPNGAVCPDCPGSKCTPWRGSRTKRKHVQCRKCRRIFSLLGQTPFKKSRLPLATWFAAIHLWFRFRGEFGPYYLKKTLGISTFKVAKEVLQNVKKTMQIEENQRRFSRLDVAPPPDKKANGASRRGARNEADAPRRFQPVS